MQSRKTRTLEDLRLAVEAAWLWDPARHRMVWANAAGVSAFSAVSVFDLVDRPFDAGEPGVRQIAALADTLAPGEARRLDLAFPSVGHGLTVTALCTTHLLADGRQGILVVAEASRHPIADVPAARAASALAGLPVALLVMSRDGAIENANAAARELLDLQRVEHVREIFENAAAADAFLQRLNQAPLTSSVEILHSRFGLRDVRITCALLPEGAAHSVMLEDITDRRALERSLTAQELQPGPVPGSGAGKNPAEAFAQLAKSLQETIDRATPQPEASRPEAPRPEATQPEAPREGKQPASPAPLTAAEARPEEPVARKTSPEAAPEKAKPARQPTPRPAAATAPAPSPQTPFVPAPVRNSLERTGEAILIGRGDTPYFATAKAAEMLAYDSSDALLVDAALWQHLKAQAASGVATMPLPDGGEATLSVRAGSIPWLNGPADQLVLKPQSQKADQRPQQKTEPKADLPKAEVPVAAIPAPPLVSAPPTAQSEQAEDRPVADAAPTPEPAAETEAPLWPEIIEAGELKAMLDVAADGIIALDEAGQILSFSAGAEAIFGMAAADVTGKPLSDLLAPECRKPLRDYISALKGPGLARVFNDGREFTAVVRQGGEVPLFVTLGRLQSPLSRASFCAVVRDITQWKRTEAELRQAKEAAERASRQKSDFLAGISHEIRTPLNAILGFSDVMRTERFGEIRNDKYRGYANDIHASGAHLLSLVNDLLDLSKVEAGKLELDFTSVSITDVVDHALRILQADATRNGVIMRKAIPPRLPRVVADLRALRQVMLNLVSNSIKYCRAGGQVIVSAALDPTGELSLRVKDDGPGMNARELKEALEPYARVEATARDRLGTGLGLPLSKALVEANRARFSLSSEPGHGTMAEIRFPGNRVLAE